MSVSPMVYKKDVSDEEFDESFLVGTNNNSTFIKSKNTTDIF
jgi:hypothetical protein